MIMQGEERGLLTVLLPFQVRHNISHDTYASSIISILALRRPLRCSYAIFMYARLKLGVFAINPYLCVLAN